MSDAQPIVSDQQPSSFKRWFLEGQVKEVAGPHGQEGQHHTPPWRKVMCLTGVDYVSGPGHQPCITFLMAVRLSSLATLVPELLTVPGALP
ncbi:MAG: hypothetical protein U0X75_07570 [Acidobacteriota bacterium]